MHVATASLPAVVQGMQRTTVSAIDSQLLALGLKLKVGWDEERRAEPTALTRGVGTGVAHEFHRHTKRDLSIGRPCRYLTMTAEQPAFWWVAICAIRYAVRRAACLLPRRVKLACSCELDQPCHAGVLLKLANR